MFEVLIPIDKHKENNSSILFREECAFQYLKKFRVGNINSDVKNLLYICKN